MSTDAHTDERIDVEALADEIRRYLDAIGLFRREGCSPDWQAEALETCAPGEPEGR